MFTVEREDQLNPFVVRLFRQVHQLQLNHLCTKQYEQMKSYLQFLLKFTVQNVQFSASPGFYVHHLDKILVSVSDEPLIQIDVRIRRVVKP